MIKYAKETPSESAATFYVILYKEGKEDF